MSDVSTGRHRAAGRSGHGFLRVFGYAVLTLTLTLGLFSAYTYRHLNSNLTNLNVDQQLGDRPDKVHKGNGEPLNILVMGQDGRDGAGNDIVGGDPEDGNRSDTTILMHVSGDRTFAYGVSIPRDTMVERPTCYDDELNEIPGGFEQWNFAYREGGPACTINQFESVTGVRIDHFVVVDFNGFVGMVDALDGVQVCIPEEINDTEGNIHLDAGTRTVHGKEALDYVRVRHGIGNGGDIGRMKRQQAFVAAMANKVMSKGILARPDRLFRFLDAATNSLTLDHKLDSVKKIADIGMQFQDIGLDEIKFITAPWEVYEPDPNRVAFAPEAEDLWELIRTDQPLSRQLSADAVTAEEEPGSPTPAPTDSPDGESDGPDLGPSEAPDASTDEESEGPDGLLPDPAKTRVEAGLC